MDLILWRHADALSPDDNESDAARRLTNRGRKQASVMAAWLDRRLPDGAKIITSPAVRAVETAEALTTKYDRKLVVNAIIGINATPASLLIAAGWPDNRYPVVLVGHQPTLGRLAAFLLCGDEQSIAIKKSAIWWLTNRDRAREEINSADNTFSSSPVILRAAICADFC